MLLDSSFKPVYANPESIKILAYPNVIANPGDADSIMAQKILSFLPCNSDLSNGPLLAQFQSGRRLYSCKAYVLNNHWNQNLDETRIALLLERGLPGPAANILAVRRLTDLQEDPFSFAPDPRYYFFSRAHQEIYADLSRLAQEKRGIGVLLAQAGMGKTALLGCLADNLRPRSEIAMLPGSFDSRSDFIKAIMASFGVNCVAQEFDKNLRCFSNWLEEKNAAGQTVILICDDAQDISFETLEHLYILSDLESESRKLLQILMAGRQGLLEKLSNLRMEKLSKQIAAYCRLAPLDEAEVRSYIIHRLRIAGRDRQQFTSAALSSIALYSRGIPMNINMLCRHSLALAAAINLPVIDERIIADSAYDLVLRAQPAAIWDDRFEGKPDPQKAAGLLRDRRGLHLVRKP